MDNKEFLVIFEKMYHQENDTKEKITIRIQIIFTIIIALVAVSSYMLRMLDYEHNHFIAYLIVGFVALFILLLVFSCCYLVRAFWGNTFQKIAPADEIRTYSTEMRDYAKAIEEHEMEPVDVRGEIEAYLCKVYCDGATHNYYVNGKRSERVHSSFKFLLWSIVFLILAGALFIAFDMDASSPRKDFRIVDQNLGGRLGELRDELELVVKSTNNLREVILKSSSSNSGPEMKESANVEPVKQSLPEKPIPPKSRAMLDDVSYKDFEVKDDSTKK